MLTGRVSHTHVFAAILLVGTAALAALCAHIGIDVAGDFVLAHDAYDGLDHRSRTDVCTATVILAIGALVNVLRPALVEARTRRRCVRPAFEQLFGRRSWRFCAFVAALTMPALMLMEYADVAGAGMHVDDVSELLGGSAWLALSITLPTTVVVALSVRAVARAVMGSHRILVRIITQLFAFIARKSIRAVGRDARSRSACDLERRSVVSRRSAKRGPPLGA